jgi:Aerotolerance regulator N-terminal
MFGWQHPAAFWLLPAVAGPVIIHLLRVHRANRMLFPSLRFVQPSQAAAVRLRLPSDWLLLLIRMSIVGLAICAVAAPVVVTDRRVAGWNATTARAVVVDESASMRSTTAREAAQAELANATYGRTFEAKNVEHGIGRAVAWLTSAPPARRELVIVSDFQLGTVDTTATVQVPPSIGLRVVKVGRASAHKTISGTDLFGFDTVAARQQSIDLTKDTTALNLDSRQPAPIEGLRIVNATSSERDALLRTLAIAGTAAPSPHEPIAIVFAKNGTRDALAIGLDPMPLRKGWMLRAALRIREDRGVTSTAATVTGTSEVRVEAPWTPLVSDRHGHPILLAATAGNELLLRVATSPDSLFSAAVGRGALVARLAADEYSEQEIASIDPAVLAAWMRPPGAVDRTAWRTADANDSRWCWLAALLLLGVEQWLRGRRVRTAQEVTRAAA